MKTESLRYNNKRLYDPETGWLGWFKREGGLRLLRSQLNVIPDSEQPDNPWTRTTMSVPLFTYQLFVENEMKEKTCRHRYGPWYGIGRTGDWFHPLIVRRDCQNCDHYETDEH